MDIAVIKYAGKQFLVKPDEILEVEGRLADNAGDIELNEVLLLCVGDKLSVGAPLLEGVTIGAKILEVKKGKKLEIYKFKAKSRYRRHTGFRPFVTKIQIGNFGQERQEQKEKKVTKKTTAKSK